MSRSFFRSSRLLTLSLGTVPLFAIVGACGTSTNAPPIQGNPGGFGDSGTGDSTTPHDGSMHVDARPDVVVKDTSTPDAGTDSNPAGGDAMVPCTKASDCTSGVCSAKPVVVTDGGSNATPNCAVPGADCVCQVATCFDGVKNGGETGVDCGNTFATKCPICQVGQGCGGGKDCASGVCGNVAGGGTCAGDAGACTCSSPTCTDHVKNGDESDIDCGGTLCGANCNTGKTCSGNSDCVSSICTSTPMGNQCTCPTGTVEVTTSKGAPYCIDQYEVTFAQYQVFLDKDIDPATQPAECVSWNKVFAPQGLLVVPGTQTENNPVTNVNWCDAYMYCTAFGKHLCGSTTTPDDSTTPAPTPFDTNDQNDETLDEWFNACSTQGTNTYTYGNVYIPGANIPYPGIAMNDLCPMGVNECFVEHGACNTIDSPQQQSDTPTTGNPSICIFDSCNNPLNEYNTWAQGQTISCSVILPPNTTASCNQIAEQSTCHNMAGIFDMNGNVWEWTNSCGGSSGGDAGAGDYCLARGGAFDSPNPTKSTTCAANSDQPPLPRNATQAIAGGLSHEDLGFRCCL